MMNDKLLRLTGKIAQVARSITGGKDINGFMVSPATIWDVSGKVERLRELLDEYDQLMLAMHYEEKDKK